MIPQVILGKSILFLFCPFFNSVLIVNFVCVCVFMACVLGPEDSIGDSILSSLVDPGAPRRSAGLHGKCLDPWAFSPAVFETGFWCVSPSPVQRHLNLKQDKGAGEMAQIRPLPYKPGFLSSIPRTHVQMGGGSWLHVLSIEACTQLIAGDFPFLMAV